MMTIAIKSHPVWVRGLKPTSWSQQEVKEMSHPVWVRGLKQQKNIQPYGFESSHPVWVRGLKHLRLDNARLRSGVAPRVGAWIETDHFTLIMT